MRRLLLLLVLILLCFKLLPIDNIEARQGCCSHHGGVCGCSCCDGSSLSATCAPYYPHCNKASVSGYNQMEKESKWYNNGWVYLIGGIAIWIGGGWVWDKIDERKNKRS